MKTYIVAEAGVNHNGRIDTWERIKECPCFDAIDEYSGVS